MYAVSATVEVNPVGASPQLTQQQLWRGLVMKAEDAVPFVPDIESCVVLESFEGGLIREVVVRGQKSRERITFTEPVQVLFERMESTESGWISNIISESENGLLLTFTFAINFAAVVSGSFAEKERAETMKASYFRAVDKTIATVRQMVAAGEIK